MDFVTINYSDYCSNDTVIDNVQFELIEDVILKLQILDNSVSMSMIDKITQNNELSGILDYDKLNVLIKTLSLLRNQIKENL